MDQEFIDNNDSDNIKRLKEEIVVLQQKIHHLNGKIHSIQCGCKHIFLETPGMRKCQKCSLTESTYY